MSVEYEAMVSDARLRERRAHKRETIVACLGLLTFVVLASLLAISLSHNQDDPCHQALGFAQRAFMTDSDPGNPIYTANRQLFEESLRDCLK